MIKRSGTKRQKSWQQQQIKPKRPPALAPQSNGEHSAAQDSQPQHLQPQHSQPQKLPPQHSDSLHSGPQHSNTRALSAQQSESDYPELHQSGPQHLGPQHDAAQDVKLEEMCPPPMPVRVKPGSRPATATGVTNSVCHAQHQPQQQQQQPQQSLKACQQQQQQQKQQQRSLQQCEQQHQQSVTQQGTSGGADAATQPAERFQRSVRQQEVHAVPGGDLGQGSVGAVGLQGCLHRFVRPETLSKWTCSRCGTVPLFA